MKRMVGLRWDRKKIGRLEALDTSGQKGNIPADIYFGVVGVMLSVQ